MSETWLLVLTLAVTLDTSAMFLYRRVQWISFWQTKPFWTDFIVKLSIKVTSNLMWNAPLSASFSPSITSCNHFSCSPVCHLCPPGASGLESHLWWHKPDLPMRSIWLSSSLSRTHTRHCSQQCRWQMRRWILRFMPSALSGSCQDIKTQHIKLHANPDTNRQSTNPETTIRLSWCWTVLRHRFSS